LDAIPSSGRRAAHKETYYTAINSEQPFQIGIVCGIVTATALNDSSAVRYRYGMPTEKSLNGLAPVPVSTSRSASKKIFGAPIKTLGSSPIRQPRSPGTFAPRKHL
jgi:hypothetical protein